MKNITKFLLGALSAVAISTAMSSCSPYALVSSETYNNADLAQYKTFRIVTPDSISKLPPSMTMVTYYNIAAAIREQMYMRGFTEDATSPLLINIGFTEQKQISTEPLSAALPPAPAPVPPAPPVVPVRPGAPLPPPPHFGPMYNGVSQWFMYPRGYYWQNSNAQVITGIYEEGVLTMDMINFPKKEALYSASVAAILNGQGEFRNLSGIDQAVTTLFSQFPVPLLPQYKKK